MSDGSNRQTPSTKLREALDLISRGLSMMDLAPTEVGKYMFEKVSQGQNIHSLKNPISLFGLVIFMICCQDVSGQTLLSVNKDSIQSLLQPSTPNLRTILLEIGETKRTELIAPITNFLQTNKLNPQTKWSAHLALARLGDTRALDYIVQRVQKPGVNDDVVYELFPALIYTRQRQAIQYMVEVINRDDKNCQSADPENPEPINCAYRVLEFLAPVIKGFPLKTDASRDLCNRPIALYDRDNYSCRRRKFYRF